MKYFPIAFFLLCLNSVFSQETDIKQSIDALKQKIEFTDKGEKLALLDSLTKLTHYNPNFQFDSIVKQTITYAYKLDSINLGVWQTGDLIFYYANRAGNPQEGIKVFNAFEKLNLDIKDSGLLAQLYTNAGDSYFFSGQILESIPVYERAEQYALLDQDSIRYATAKTYKSAAYQDTGDYATASKLLIESAQIFQKAKDTSNLLKARNSLATLYTKIGFLEESKKEREEILDISRSMHLHKSLVPNLYNASLEQEMMGNEKERISYLKEAYKHITEPDYNSSVGSVINYALLSAYSENDSISKAEKFYTKIQATYAQRNPIPYEDNYRSALVDYYISKKEYNNALIEATWTLQYRKSIGEIRGRYLIEEKLATIYNALGDTKNSYKHYIDYVTLKDSVSSAQKTKALTYYQTLYETEKRDFKISEQQSEILLLDQENKVKNQWLLFGGLGLFLGFIFIYLIRSRNFSRKEKQNQELFSQELIKAQEDQRTEVARDLHDSVGQKLMLLTKQVKSFNDTNVEQLAKNTLEELRGISRGLYPATFERIGVTESIQFMINEVDANTNLFFISEIDNIDKTLSKQDELHLYRIIQEVLNNIVKHANAKSVFITITKKANTIETIIKDNGIGFEFTEKLHSSSTIGMKTLLERAKIIKSKLLFDSNKNEGTTIELITPIS